MTEAPTRTLYDRLGGGTAVRSVVDRFYELLLLDPVVRPYFADIELTRLRRHQALFLSQVAGGPTEYDGRDMLAAHADRGIDDRAFDTVIDHLAAALREHRVAPPDIDEVLAAARGLRDTVVEPPT